MGDGWKVWYFIGYQYIVFGVIYAFMAAVPDIPADIEIQVERQEFICDKLINKMADDDDDPVSSDGGDSDADAEDADDDGADKKGPEAFTEIELPGISDRADLLPLKPTKD